MEHHVLSADYVQQFGDYLVREEKSPATQEKYLRDIRNFTAFAGDSPVTKERVIAYKSYLMEKQYSVRSVNSMLAAVNSFLNFLGWGECKVKAIRVQRQSYTTEDKELTKAEYLRLLKAAPQNGQMHAVLQTICGTGIRVSELKYFTVETVQRGEITVHCKSKIRTILIPGRLKTILLNYARKHHICTGCIFHSGKGTPLDRSTIWSKMKKLCTAAGVNPAKVFPHNLRKLFARTFYSLDKDIAKLADILGHSSIETTRIYIITTGSEHRKKIEQLKLVQ